MPRTLSRFGPAYRIEGRTLERSSEDVELLETVGVRLSVWKERGRAQRWVSLELLSGAHAGLETFVPLEVLEGEGQRDPIVGQGGVVLE